MHILKSKKGFNLHWIYWAVFAALFVFGAMKIFESEEIDMQLKELLVNESTKQPLVASVFVKSLDDLTPTIKLPFVDKHIFLITEFPVYSWFHVIVTLVLIFTSWLIMKIFKAKRWTMILVFLLMLILGYFVASIILYIAYTGAAEELGFTLDEAKQFREQYNVGYSNVVAPLIVISFFALFTLGKTIFIKVEKG